jgi:hypothetical protein
VGPVQQHALALGLLAVVALAGCGSDEPRDVPWRLIGQDGRTLRLEVEAGGPPCDEIQSVDVDETPTVVTVTVLAGPRPGVDCNGTTNAALGTFQLTATLREPLGSRELR